MVYLLIGEESLSKDAKLKKIKEEFLARDIKDFNLDVLYAKGLNLQGLQERLLYLPLKAQKRIIIIKDAQNLKEELKEFILKYVKTSHPQISLVLDYVPKDSLDEFIKHIARYAQIFRFSEPRQIDAFVLARQIEFKKVNFALRVLNELLLNGEKPERILGGLRYNWERKGAQFPEADRITKLLLNCDLDIKTGRLKPDFALERLVIKLCYL